MLIGWVWYWCYYTTMINDSVRQRTWKRAINIAHEEIAVEERSILCFPEQIILLVNRIVINEVMLITPGVPDEDEEAGEKARPADIGG
jgi:hypothetical protein